MKFVRCACLYLSVDAFGFCFYTIKGEYLECSYPAFCNHVPVANRAGTHFVVETADTRRGDCLGAVNFHYFITVSSSWQGYE